MKEMIFFFEPQMKGTFGFFVKVLQLSPFNHFFWVDHNFKNLAKKFIFFENKVAKIILFYFSNGKRVLLEACLKVTQVVN
jgi:hypothetical protein